MIVKENDDKGVNLTLSKVEMGLLYTIICKIGGAPDSTARMITEQWEGELSLGLCWPNEKFVDKTAFELFRTSVLSSQSRITFIESDVSSLIKAPKTTSEILDSHILRN